MSTAGGGPVLVEALAVQIADPGREPQAEKVEDPEDHLGVAVRVGTGLYLQINGRPVDNAYGAIVMAELAALRDDFPAVRVDVAYRSASRPAPAAMARLINIELDRNEIWD